MMRSFRSPAERSIGCQVSKGGDASTRKYFPAALPTTHAGKVNAEPCKASAGDEHARGRSLIVDRKALLDLCNDAPIRGGTLRCALCRPIPHQIL